MTKKLLMTSALVASMSGAAWAEGLERVTFSPAFMFEEGTYVNTSFGLVEPDLPISSFNIVGPVALPTPVDVAGDFTVVNAAFKWDVTDNFSMGIAYTNNGNGVSIDYTGAGLPIQANVRSNQFSILGKYAFDGGFSAYAGAKFVSINGAQILLPTGPASAQNLTHGRDSGVGLIAGVAYEKPEIAMRISLTYESDIDMSFAASGFATPGPVAVSGTTTASIGDAITLEFQTGIAQDTLLFGSIRDSRWADNQVVIPNLGQISSFEDGRSFSLGIARRISDTFAVSVSGFYDPADGCDSASELSPQCENKAITVGGRFTLENGTKISVGVTHSRRGDATTGQINGEFNDSKVNSVGVSIGRNF